MAQIPKTVKIVGKRWKIKTTESVIEFPDKSLAVGLCEVEKCKLSLCTSMDKQQMRDTLWHEITHAADFTLDLGLTEQQVHALAAAQYQIMRENKTLMRWLLC